MHEYQQEVVQTYLLFKFIDIYNFFMLPFGAR